MVIQVKHGKPYGLSGANAGVAAPQGDVRCPEGKGVWRKRTPVCNEQDRANARAERQPTSRWSSAVNSSKGAEQP